MAKWYDETHKTWADWRYDKLMEKGRENWDEDDWDAYNYIENLWAEREYFDQLEG